MGVDANLGRANVAIRATLDKLDGDLSKAHGTVDGAVGKMARLVKSGFKAAGVAAAAGISVATGAVAGLAGMLGKLAIQAAPVEGISSAFDGLAESAGVGTDEMLRALQRGSAGMVSQRDLMLSFNKAAQLVSTDFAVQLPEAMGYLSKVAASTGQSMDYLMNSLVVGVGRVSPLILDNLGIQVGLAEATARAAQMYGVEEEALTKAQQQAGLMALVLERLQANTAAMPDTTESAAAKLAQMKARIQDVKDEIGLAFLPTLSTLLGTVADLADRYLPPLLGKIEQLGPKVAEAAEMVGNFVGALLEGKSPVEAFKELLGELFPALEGLERGEMGRAILERIGEALGKGTRLVRGWVREHIVAPMVKRIAETDWGEVARSILSRIGEGLSTGYDIVRGWVTDHIVVPVGAFITETDWGEVARSILSRIGEGLSTGYDIVRGWVTDHIVTPLSTFITETDWGEVAGSLQTKIGETWETVKGFASEKLGGLLESLTGAGEEAAPEEGGVVGVLDKIAGFVGGPGGTAISVIGAIVGLITGIGAPIAVAIGAVRLLSWTWEENFGGIRDITSDVLGGVEEKLRSLGVQAVKTGVKFAVSTAIGLMPMYEKAKEVWQWIDDTAIPKLKEWGEAFLTGLQPHIDRMSESLEKFNEEIGPRLFGVWENLEDAGNRVGGAIDEHLTPSIDRLRIATGKLLDLLGIDLTEEDFFKGLGDLAGFLLEAHLDTLLWTITTAIDFLSLAIEGIGIIIEGYVIIFGDWGKIIEGYVIIFEDWVEVMDDIIDVLFRLEGKNLAEIFEELTGVELPEWLKPGSPPPLYYALMDIGRAMDQLSSRQMPAFGGLGQEGMGGGQGDRFAWTSYAPIIVEGVQDGRGLIDELQALAIG